MHACASPFLYTCDPSNILKSTIKPISRRMIWKSIILASRHLIYTIYQILSSKILEPKYVQIDFKFSVIILYAEPCQWVPWAKHSFAFIFTVAIFFCFIRQPEVIRIKGLLVDCVSLWVCMIISFMMFVNLCACVLPVSLGERVWSFAALRHVRWFFKHFCISGRLSGR